MRNVKGILGRIFFQALGRGEKFVAGVQHKTRQRGEKIKDAGLDPLVLAEGFVIHKQIDQWAARLALSDPVCEFVSQQRILGPRGIGKTKGDVVAETVVFQQQFDGRMGGTLNVVTGTTRTQYGIGALGQHGMKTHIRSHAGDIIIVNQFGVAEGFLVYGRNARRSSCDATAPGPCSDSENNNAKLRW